MAQPVDACVCCLDSINHLADLDEVRKTFLRVHDCLKESGIFIFDANTVYKHEKILADNSFVFDNENYFLAWDNELLDNATVRIILDFFVYNGKNYDRYSEEFTGRAYEESQLRATLDGSFEALGVYDETTLDPPGRLAADLFCLQKEMNYGKYCKIYNERRQCVYNRR